MSKTPNVTVNKKRTCKKRQPYKPKTFATPATVSDVLAGYIANIYIMTMGNRCKIGISHDVERRYKTLRLQFPAIKIYAVFTPTGCTALSVEQSALSILQPNVSAEMPGREWLNCRPDQVETAIIEGAKQLDQRYVCEILRPIAGLLG